MVFEYEALRAIFRDASAISAIDGAVKIERLPRHDPVNRRAHNLEPSRHAVAGEMRAGEPVAIAFVCLRAAARRLPGKYVSEPAANDPAIHRRVVHVTG